MRNGPLKNCPGTGCYLLVTLLLAPIHAAFGVTCHLEWAPMRDGVLLATEVYLPEAGESSLPVPVILQRTPYNRPAPPSAPSDCNNGQMIFLAGNGYAALNQDVRGRFRSEGTMNAMVQEAADGYDAIEWAAAQPWSNGKVATIGGSYVGLTQWQPAIRTPPHLVATAPRVTASDYHDHWTYVNGVFDLWFGQSWMLLTFAQEQLQRNLEAKGLPRAEVDARVMQWVADGRRDILTKWVWKLPLERFDEFRKLAPYYYDWLAHPTYDRFWEKLDVEPRYAHVTVPSLNLGGWYDIFQIGTVRNFQGMRARGGSERARDGSKLYMWSSCHACPGTTFAGAIDFGPDNALDQNALYLRWFDHWLKGVDNGIDTDPAVNIFVMLPPDSGTSGDGFWITAEQFPLPGTRLSDLYLSSGGNANTASGDGVLVAEPVASPPDRFVYDPRDPVPTTGGNMCCINDLVPSGAFDQSAVEQRDDVLVYTSEPLAEDSAVIGPVRVTFWATTSAKDTDFTAKLVDVHPDGFAHNLLDRIVRASSRHGSKLPLDPIAPGEVVQYTIDLGFTSTVFKQGHRVRLEISSSNFPHYARNLNTGVNAKDKDGHDKEKHGDKKHHGHGHGVKMVNAEQTILHDPEHPSHLELPIVPGIIIP